MRPDDCNTKGGLFRETRSLSARPRAEDTLPPHAGPSTPQIGDVIDEHLRIEGVLGSGGMGTVYLARDERLARRVAVKLLHADLVTNDATRASFLAEGRAMAQVSHPNVVSIHACSEFEGSPYLVMEYVRGDNLSLWAQRKGELTVPHVVSLIESISHGVEAIHAAGAVHRDLKPSNVMVGTDGRLAVTDFGLALSPELASRQPIGDQLSGTPAYIAPEVARGDTLDPGLATRIDVYALGSMTFELLTGRLPFVGDTLRAVLLRHAFEAPPRPSEHRSELPPELDAAILRALHPSPRERTESVAALREDLQAAIGALSKAPSPRRVLLVDDDVSALQGIGAVLRTQWPDVEVIATADVNSAVGLAKRHQPDLVITDYNMPSGGGPALTHALRSLPATADVPIIVVTGSASAQDWHELRELGADRFLVKPIDIDALIAMIRSVLDRSK